MKTFVMDKSTNKKYQLLNMDIMNEEITVKSLESGAIEVKKFSDFKATPDLTLNNLLNHPTINEDGELQDDLIAEIIQRGIEVIQYIGYSEVSKENILINPLYSQLFSSFLKSNREKWVSKEVDFLINTIRENLTTHLSEIHKELNSLK